MPLIQLSKEYFQLFVCDGYLIELLIESLLGCFVIDIIFRIIIRVVCLRIGCPKAVKSYQAIRRTGM